MSSINAGNQLYNVISENQLTSILSHYSTEYVLSVVDNALESRFNPNAILRQPNVVAAWEQNFKQLLVDFDEAPDAKSQVMAVREATYKEIIEKICRTFSLNFTIDDNIDYYSAAYYLYDFFVANFNVNLITFFSNYIYKEKSGIYESLDLSMFRKNKDSSTIYGKKTYKDVKLAIISANIDYVVTHICGIDIALGDIFAVIYNQKDLLNYMLSLVSSSDDFFKNYYAQILQTPIKPILLTEIRMSIRALAMANNDVDLEAEQNED